MGLLHRRYSNFEQIGGRMYLVDKRISFDPVDLLSVHPATYLFKVARPAQNGNWEAWTQEQVIALDPSCRGGESSPGKRRLRGRYVPKIEGNKRVGGSPICSSMYFLNRHSIE